MIVFAAIRGEHHGLQLTLDQAFEEVKAISVALKCELSASSSAIPTDFLSSQKAPVACDSCDPCKDGTVRISRSDNLTTRCVDIVHNQHLPNLD